MNNMASEDAIIGLANTKVDKEGLDDVGLPSYNFYPQRETGSSLPGQVPNIETTSEWAREELNEAYAKGLIPESIISEGWQAPTSRVAAAESIVTIIEKAIGKTLEEIADENGWDLLANHFSDTDDKYVTFLRHAGVVSGIGDNKYNPTGEYNRAMIVAMIGTVAEKLFNVTIEGECSFTDVPDWAARYIGYAEATMRVTGIGGGLFDSFTPIQNQATIVLGLRAFTVWE